MIHMDRKLVRPAPSMPRDARQRRTRDALHQALFRLLAEKPFADITVRDLTAAADIGYATFFRHYPTREALLEDAAAEQIRTLVDMALPQLDTHDSRASSRALCLYVHEHRALWRALLVGGAQQTMREELIRVSAEVAANRGDSGSYAEVGVIVAASSIVEILAWWLRQDAPAPVEEVAGLLDHFVIAPAVRR